MQSCRMLNFYVRSYIGKIWTDVKIIETIHRVSLVIWLSFRKIMPSVVYFEYSEIWKIAA